MAPDKLDMVLEREKLRLDRKRLKLDAKKANTERWKSFWTSLGLVVPLLIAAIPVAYSAMTFQRTAEIQFSTKAVEVALSASSGPDAIGRARVIAALYPDLLPTGYEQRLAALDRGRYGDATVFPKMELMKLLAQQPAHRGQLLADWRMLFPRDTWLPGSLP
jgi:hypothetical protein